MIERFHRQLKTAIKSHQTEEWAEILPVIMMGIRAAWKEDLQTTPAEIVFGESIRLPGQFLEETCAKFDDTEDFAARLNKIIRNLQPKLKRHGEKAIFIYKDLATTQRVFLRHDAPTRALQPPYDGPFKVLNRGEKTFKICVNGRPVNVSIDRLKPAYILEQEEPEPAQSSTGTTQTPEEPQQQQRTRSGRISRPPVRFQGL
ncbi:uncharacterized protein LOC112451806 [Temnothorax curvispinosus]|uniref:Uncharacterized protein LOC112451806 n=1 Tax=Temnothorax curvispinosus TaxID=300111 RepID=A0A6J1PDD1_9HYME|nr:uncharacterized protein LOC112451806 [Temnothorax curvispinosus]